MFFASTLNSDYVYYHGNIATNLLEEKPKQDRETNKREKNNSVLVEDLDEFVEDLDAFVEP